MPREILGGFEHKRTPTLGASFTEGASLEDLEAHLRAAKFAKDVLDIVAKKGDDQ